MTQTETIVWHKWPEVKPKEDGLYLIDEWLGGIDVAVYADGEYWNDVRAWAELPRGWEDK